MIISIGSSGSIARNGRAGRAVGVFCCSKSAAWFAGGFVLAAGCSSDVTPPADSNYSGTYTVNVVVEASMCAPQPRPTGPWNPDGGEAPDVGIEFGAGWVVEHSGNQLTIVDVPLPHPHPEGRTSIAVTLASDLTFTLGPAVVIEGGTIETDTGLLGWKVEQSLDGAVSVVNLAPRISLTIQGTETFTQIGSGALFTTCVLRFAQTGVRTSP